MPAKFRPSSAHRWIACPGSIKASAGAPNTTSEAAAVGTALHYLGELCLKRDKDPAEYIGEPLRALNPGDAETVPDRKVTEEDINLVAAYVNYVRSRHTKRHELLVEVRLQLALDLAGTADAVVVTEDAESGCRTVEVIDLKTGHNDVPAGCEQLMVYGLAAARKFDASIVRATIVQPPTKSEPETVEYARQELEEWYRETVEPAMAAAEVEDPPLAAGAHCRYCPAAPTCSARIESLEAEAMADFSPVPAEGAIVPAAPPDDIARMIRVVQAKDQLRAFVTACEEALLDLAQRGVELPGLKLVRGRKVRQWRNEESTFRALARLGVPAKERRKMKLKSPSQIEALLKASEVPAAKREDFLARHVYTPEGPLKLVAESARGQPVDPRPKFSAVEELPPLDMTFLE